MSALIAYLFIGALFLLAMGFLARWGDNLPDPGPRPIFDDMCSERVYDGAGDEFLLRRAVR